MDTGQPESPDPHLLAVINMTVQKAEEIVGEYLRIDTWVAQAEANIQAARDRQEALRALYGQCEGTAQLFGFDLEHEREEAAASSDILDKMFAETAIPERRQSIREIILDLGREANGQPLRAASVRAELVARYGKDVHDKTVGMTLYRLSKEGAFQRRGYDWYFVPEAQRLREAPDIAAELSKQRQANADASNGKPPE